MTRAIKCAGCRGNGVCLRCRGSGNEGMNEVVGDAVIVGPVPCRRCGASGVCPGCRGSGWVGMAALPTKKEGER